MILLTSEKEIQLEKTAGEAGCDSDSQVEKVLSSIFLYCKSSRLRVDHLVELICHHQSQLHKLMEQVDIHNNNNTRTIGYQTEKKSLPSGCIITYSKCSPPP